ncbi:acyl-protein thioesterase 1 [Papilio machaon]|uniref:acyl-protein thioesterase 1 n=1 Tax=Papilio machaon TaxID=76193 RepID=UPI001E663DE2|nr:acyl-protein thioesterase 1 [Papilio machaon]
MEPNPVIIAATAKQTASLIFLHGLGDTGHGWASTIAAIRGPHIKVICPTASTMPVTLNAGFRMPSWFDLRTLDATAPEDEEGILRATELIHGMIEDEIKSGIPITRILLGGFSQGGALALHAALTYPETLAGVMSLSCWLPRHAHFPGAVKAPTILPIFQAHGDCDPVVPFKWGQMTASFLKTFMKNIEFNTYQGLTHSTSEEELKDMKVFIERMLPASAVL